MRVMVLEGDPRLRRAYAHRLRADAHAVDEMSTLEEARKALIDVAYDCLVLDRQLPDGDSLDIVLDLRSSVEPPSTLLVSGYGDGEDRAAALEAGADDYMTKPACLDELAVRVRKLCIRRSSGVISPVRLGRVVVDRGRQDVAIDGCSIHLTPMQYGVFDYLVANRERMVPIQEILDHCWDANRDFLANPLHSHICRLRKVFRGVLRFELVRGAGYVITVE